METIRLFVGFYIEATKRSFSERSIMIYAIIGTIFGMAVPALFQEGAPLHTYGDHILVIIAANPMLLLFIPIGLLMSLFSSAALSLSFATPPRTFFQAALTAAGRLPHLIALKAALLASSTAALSLLSIPGIIAIAFNAPLATSLLLIGFVIFIPIFCHTHFHRVFRRLSYPLFANRHTFIGKSRLFACFEKYEWNCGFRGSLVVHHSYRVRVPRGGRSLCRRVDHRLARKSRFLIASVPFRAGGILRHTDRCLVRLFRLPRLHTTPGKGSLFTRRGKDDTKGSGGNRLRMRRRYVVRNMTSDRFSHSWAASSVG